MLDIYEFITWTKEERQAHLDLSTPCVYRGTNSTECRGLLAHALNTTVPRGIGIHCCHACHDGRCSNWRHLYWGTAAENHADAVECGQITPPRPSFGNKNGNFGVPAWRNGNGKREDWSTASDIYDDFTKNGWSWSSWGRGREFMMSRYGIGQGPARLMIKRFKSGWVPIEDPEWLEEFKPE